MLQKATIKALLLHRTSVAGAHVALAALLSGCGPVVEDTGGDPSDVTPLVLDDGHGWALEVDLEIEQRSVSSDADFELDWSGIDHDLWGRADLEGEPARLILYSFPALNPDEVVARLASADLAQADVGIHVQCASAEQRCALEDFVFEAGHAVDLGALFVEGGGTWLAMVYSDALSAALAYLVLIPSDEAAHAPLVPITSASSSGALRLEAADPLPVTGSPASLDWHGLTVDSQGRSLRLNEVEQLVVARVPDADPEGLGHVLSDLASTATELWTADVGGRTECALDELVPVVGEAGPPRLDQGGPWVVGLVAHDQPAPVFAYVTVLGGTP